MDEADWERRVEALWVTIDDHDETDFRTAMERLVAERPPGDPVGLFELASAFDSTGRPEPAAERYRAALDRGLGGYRRRRAVIQLASSLRNLGQVDESLALLEAERDTGFDELDDELAAFLALALTSARPSPSRSLRSRRTSRATRVRSRRTRQTSPDRRPATPAACPPGGRAGPATAPCPSRRGRARSAAPPTATPPGRRRRAPAPRPRATRRRSRRG